MLVVMPRASRVYCREHASEVIACGDERVPRQQHAYAHDEGEQVDEAFAVNRRPRVAALLLVLAQVAARRHTHLKVTRVRSSASGRGWGGGGVEPFSGVRRGGRRQVVDLSVWAILYLRLNPVNPDRACHWTYRASHHLMHHHWIHHHRHWISRH